MRHRVPNFIDWLDHKGIAITRDDKDEWEKEHSEWLKEKRQYFYQEKNEQIMNALEAIKASGFTAELKNFDNAHIQAISKSGKKMSFYAGTGTIVGYGDTNIKGIDEFKRLLKSI